MDHASHTNEEFKSKPSDAEQQLIVFRVACHPRRTQSQLVNQIPTRKTNNFQIRRFSTLDFMKPKRS